MKGQTGIELAMLAVIGLVGVIAIYFPPIIFKTSSATNIRYEYNYDNSQLVLLSLLSTTVPDNLVNNIAKPSIELIGGYVQLKPQLGMDPLNKKLESLTKAVNLECYKLSITTTATTLTTTTITTQTTATTTDIVKSTCEPSQYKFPTNIPLPYKPDNLVKTITLVVGK